jgi:Tfp pilus assembly protein PilP
MNANRVPGAVAAPGAKQPVNSPVSAASKIGVANTSAANKPGVPGNVVPVLPGKPTSAAVTAKPSAMTPVKPGAVPANAAGMNAMKPGVVPAKPGATMPTPPAAATVKPGSMPLKPGVPAAGAVAAGQKGGAVQAANAMKPADKNAAAKPTTATNAPAKPEEKPVEVVRLQPTRHSTVGMRDPFISPIVKAMNGPGNGCTTGKRCLVIDQIKLKGVVESPNGMIAVVENAADRTYFLHENDPLFNGMVIHITNDSVVFRENILDSSGRSTGTRDVVKRVNAPVV